MRPVLKPGLRRVWRDRSTLQLGVSPPRAFAVTGLSPPVSAVLDALDGTRDDIAVFAYAASVGVDEDTTRRLLDVLAAHGALDDAAADTGPLLRLERSEREQLAPDVESLSLLGGRAGDGLRLLTRRRRAVVEVHGAGRVGSALACHLAASGIGHLVVRDMRPTCPADVSPGGLGADDVGRPREQAVRDAVRRLAPSVTTALPGGVDLADLAVLAPDGPVDPSQQHAMLRRGIPHLFAGIRETTGVVGPLVLPGRSSCMHCHDLYRTDRDPAWPTVLAQLQRGDPERACDVTLASAVAAHAALQVLAHLDGVDPVAAVDGTLEVSLHDGRMRRRSWQPHPSCGCRWAEQVDDEAAAARRPAG